MCRAFIRLPWENQIKKQEKHNHNVFEKFTQLVAREGIGDCKKKLKIVNVKSQQ